MQCTVRSEGRGSPFGCLTLMIRRTSYGRFPSQQHSPGGAMHVCTHIARLAQPTFCLLIGRLAAERTLLYWNVCSCLTSSNGSLHTLLLFFLQDIAESKGRGECFFCGAEEMKWIVNEGRGKRSQCGWPCQVLDFYVLLHISSAL
jgi:hypothetical protein